MSNRLPQHGDEVPAATIANAFTLHMSRNSINIAKILWDETRWLTRVPVEERCDTLWMVIAAIMLGYR